MTGPTGHKVSSKSKLKTRGVFMDIFLRKEARDFAVSDLLGLQSVSRILPKRTRNGCRPLFIRLGLAVPRRRRRRRRRHLGRGALAAFHHTRLGAPRARV